MSNKMVKLSISIGAGRRNIKASKAGLSEYLKKLPPVPEVEEAQMVEIIAEAFSALSYVEHYARAHGRNKPEAMARLQ